MRPREGATATSRRRLCSARRSYSSPSRICIRKSCTASTAKRPTTRKRRKRNLIWRAWDSLLTSRRRERHLRSLPSGPIYAITLFADGRVAAPSQGAGPPEVPTSQPEEPVHRRDQEGVDDGGGNGNQGETAPPLHSLPGQAQDYQKYRLVGQGGDDDEKHSQQEV